MIRSVLLCSVALACAHSEKQAWPGAVASPVAESLASSARVEAESQTREPPPLVPGERCVESAELVRMDLVRADVRDVLQAMADRANINLVLADDVKGVVTVRLDGVPLDRALVTIAQAAGLALDTDRCVMTVGPRHSQ